MNTPTAKQIMNELRDELLEARFCNNCVSVNIKESANDKLKSELKKTFGSNSEVDVEDDYIEIGIPEKDYNDNKSKYDKLAKKYWSRYGGSDKLEKDVVKNIMFFTFERKGVNESFSGQDILDDIFGNPLQQLNKLSAIKTKNKKDPVAIAIAHAENYKHYKNWAQIYKTSYDIKRMVGLSGKDAEIYVDTIKDIFGVKYK